MECIGIGAMAIAKKDPWQAIIDCSKIKEKFSKRDPENFTFWGNGEPDLIERD